MSLAYNPYNQYKKQAITTANPGKLLVMLFDGAIKFSGQARLAIEGKNVEQANIYIKKCQDIIDELMGSLNMDYEISKQLYQLYEYINHQFLQANIQKDTRFLDEADRLLRDFRETWLEANKIVKKSGGEIGEQI